MSAIDFYGNEPGNSKSVVFLCSSPFGRFLYNLTLFLQIPKIMGAFLLIVIIVGIIGYFTCSKEARVMRDVDRMIERNAEETKKRHGINK